MEKEIFTTYEASKICHVDLSTVIDWVEKGLLPAYRTPGGHRRIKKDDLVEFMKKYHLPLPSEWEVKKRKVLIIDDEPKIVSFCIRVLKKLTPPVEVETAEDGFTGGKKISAFQPDLVILDLRLPGIDGYELCRTIRADERLKDIKILAITAYDSPETRDKIIACGANAYLAKPFEIVELMKSVQGLLSK